MSVNWIQEGEEDSPSREELITLYGLFQSRQIADLDMLHKYVNYYIAALLAMLAAFVLGLTKGYDTKVAGALVVLPTFSFILCLQGKLMAFRFYRRYNEGRVRLNKIEYLLGLHAPVTCLSLPKWELWSDDKGFIIGRYRDEMSKESSSRDFIWRRSRPLIRNGYGAGYINQITFTVFAVLFTCLTIALPVGLLFASTSENCKTVNWIGALFMLVIQGAVLAWYLWTSRRFEDESYSNEVSQKDEVGDQPGETGLSR